MADTEEGSGQTEELARTVWDNGRLLTMLREESRRQVSLAKRLDRSRRSVTRTLNNLEESHLVEQRDEEWGLTIAGTAAVDLFELHSETWSTLSDAGDLLSSLPNDADIGCRMMDGMDVVEGLDAAPQAAFRVVEASIRTANHVQAISPIVVDRYVDVINDKILQGMETELVLPVEVIHATVDLYSREWQDSLAAMNCSIWSMEDYPDFGLAIVDQEEVFVGIYRDGSLAGTLRNDTEASVEWATEIFDCCRDDATSVISLRDGAPE